MKKLLRLFRTQRLQWPNCQAGVSDINYDALSRFPPLIVLKLTGLDEKKHRSGGAFAFLAFEKCAMRAACLFWCVSRKAL